MGERFHEATENPSHKPHNAMTSKRNSRRDFVKTLATGTAGAVIGSGISMPAYSYNRIRGANDRVRVGIVGFSNRSRGALIPALLTDAKEKNFELVAVSDIWNRRREEGVAFLKEHGVAGAAPMRNNEELYEQGDVDAVIIATADFQHALHCVQAVEAGCDVYVEKPFANIMEDARKALKTVEESDRIVQVGTQRRSAPNYHMANEFIRSGKFGDIVMVEMSWNVNQPGRWRRPELVAAIREEDTDWKRYLMNRPYEPWDPRHYLEFRLFWPYSSGIPDQWMVHQIDTVHWFTGLPHPRSVSANGGIYKWQDGRENFDTMTAVFDYGPLNDPSKGFQVVYSSRQTNAAGGVKELYYSNGGTLNLDTNMITPEGGLSQRMAEAMDMEPFLLPEMELADTQMETAADTGVDSATLAHMRNWMDCVRDRKQPNADIHAAYNHSVALCMTIEALHTGKRVTFDRAQQEVVAS
jgi:predicted dehydrogenase